MIYKAAPNKGRFVRIWSIDKPFNKIDVEKFL